MWNIHKAIIFILLCTFVYSSPPNCQTVNASNSNLCDTCNAGYYPQQDKSGCSNSLSNCVLYSGQNCVQCSSSYGVYNNVCVNNISYCAYYLSQSLCSSCHTESGYYLNSSITNCYNSINNCELYSSSTTCQQCLSGYSLATDNTNCYIAPTPQCFKVSATDKYSCGTCSSSYYLTSQNTCQQCNVAHCSSCNQDGTCAQCINNAYTIQNGNCVCNQGFYKSQDYSSQTSTAYSCQQCSPTCNTCSSYNQCTTCKGNRSIDQNCECPSGYANDATTGGCARCPLGQFLNGSTCVTNCPIGYYNDYLLRECSLCSQQNNMNDQQCSNAVSVTLEYSKNSQIIAVFSQKVGMASNISNLQTCFSILIVDDSSNTQNSTFNINISQQSDQVIEIALVQDQTYTEKQLIIERVEQNCFLTKADSQLISYPIIISPNQIYVSPMEDLLSQPDNYNTGMKAALYVIGSITIVASFIGISFSSSIMIETLQVIFCFLLIDIYYPLHLVSVFEAIDIYNFRILNYIFSGFNGVNLKRDNLLFGYNIEDQYLSGRFFQRGFLVGSFFYNGLTYLFLIILFYVVYLFLTKTFLAPYNVPLASPQKDSESLHKKDISNTSQRIDLIPKSPQELTADPSISSNTGQLNHLRTENEKIFESNKYEKQNYYLLQMVIHIIKISYIPLSFAIGLQLKNYSQANQVNSFSFFCAIASLILIIYSCGYLVYRDIKKAMQNPLITKSEEFEEYSYQVSELKLIRADSKKNEMEYMAIYYSVIQAFVYSLSAMLISWLDTNADILLYCLIVMNMLLLVLTLYSPFNSHKNNFIHFISFLMTFLILLALLAIKNLNSQIGQSNNSSQQSQLFQGTQYVALFIVFLVLLYAVFSFVYQCYSSYNFIKNGGSFKNLASVHSFSPIQQTKNPVITVENVDEKDQVKQEGSDSKNKIRSNPMINDLNERRKSFADVKNANRRPSLITQMQIHNTNSSQKQIFVAPRKSLSTLKNEASNQISNSTFGEQVSTNPSSIQVIELEDIQKLVRENKKMEQKMILIEKKQQQMMKQLHQKQASDVKRNSELSHDTDESSDEDDKINQKERKKQSLNQSINTIEEEEENHQQNNDNQKNGQEDDQGGQRRKRRGLSQVHIPQTPPSLARIQMMETDVFHFGEDIQVDTKKQQKNRNAERQNSIKKNNNRLESKKSKTMVLDEDNNEIFNYNPRNQSSNQKILNKKQNQLPESSPSSEEDNEEDLNFWKNSRKELRKQNNQNRVKSLIIQNQ